MKTIDDAINQLEELVNSSKTMPFANKSLIDAERVKDIILDMRNCLPEEIKRARYIDNEKDKILQEANEQANEIINTAEERSNALMQSTNARVQTLISENNITQEALKQAKTILNKANERANEIVSNAQKKADNLTQATNEYIIKNFVNAEQTLSSGLDGIRKTKEMILKVNTTKNTE